MGLPAFTQLEYCNFSVSENGTIARVHPFLPLEPLQPEFQLSPLLLSQQSSLSYPSLLVSIYLLTGLSGNIKRSRRIRIMNAPTILNIFMAL